MVKYEVNRAPHGKQHAEHSKIRCGERTRRKKEREERKIAYGSLSDRKEVHVM